MGLLDVLQGRVRPAAGIPAQSPEEVLRALLALDRPTAPYIVRRATPTEKCDVVAEWRIVDAHWYEIFAKAALSRNFTIFMRLDAATQTVRALDRTTTLAWRAGWPTSHVEGEVRWGRSFETSFGAAIGFTERLQPGVVYSYRFVSSEIKDPLQSTTAAMGWTWTSVGLGRL